MKIVAVKHRPRLWGHRLKLVLGVARVTCQAAALLASGAPLRRVDEALRLAEQLRETADRWPR